MENAITYSDVLVLNRNPVELRKRWSRASESSSTAIDKIDPSRVYQMTPKHQ